MIFPRLLAVAERAWHEDAWENDRSKLSRNKMKEESWTKFANTLGYKELARLDKLDIAYHIPLPGARYALAFPFVGRSTSIKYNVRTLW